ncbi:hypothetical protein IAR55_003407 [Kwoniella newhampshirensis]|uniref:Ribosome biogenesis protein SLX9 n=1 Tax=Kwoniella newhampshirensis TaxID=1651941 RepID=A0AAW0YWW5_9TREE
MPRIARSKARLHSSAVPLSSKLKGFPEPDAQPDVSETITPIDAGPSSSRGSKLNPLPSRSDARLSPKIEKRKLMSCIARYALDNTAPHPYITPSKSHLKREKRKAKSQLGTDLSSLETALAHVIPLENTTAVHSGATEDREGELGGRKVRKSKEQMMRDKEEARRRAIEREMEKGKIGEGKGRTLGEKKRREAVQEAAKRIPAVMGHPAYKQNPWAAIREHVGNTVAVKEKPVTK